MSKDTRKPLRTSVDRNGRIVLPTEARRALGAAAGDAVCLATAAARNALVYTADRAWKGLAVGVEIRLLR